MGPVAIARLCHVVPETVYRWIEEGKLPAFKTVGGHRWVFARDVEILLKSLKLPIPQEMHVEASLKILVVDDEEDIRRFVSRVVKRLDPAAVVVEARDGFEAGRQVVLVKPDLVVLDLGLPGVDGFQVCRAIRADPNMKGVKILAITGLPIDEARRRILEEGADEFLAKPFEIHLFEEKLGTLLGLVRKEVR